MHHQVAGEEKKGGERESRRKEMSGGEGNIYFPSLASFFNTKLFQWFLRLTYLSGKIIQDFEIWNLFLLVECICVFYTFPLFLFSVFCLVPTVCQALHTKPWRCKMIQFIIPAFRDSQSIVLEKTTLSAANELFAHLAFVVLCP